MYIHIFIYVHTYIDHALASAVLRELLEQRVPGSGIRALGFGFRVSGVWCRDLPGATIEESGEGPVEHRRWLPFWELADLQARYLGSHGRFQA